MKMHKSSILGVLVAGLFLSTAAFGQDAGMDAVENDELDEEQQEQVEPVSDEEINHFAGIQLTVRREQQELEAEITEIRRGSALSAGEFRRLQRAVENAGGDLEQIDEALLEDERYNDVVTDLADVRSRSTEIVEEAVAQSPVDESRFNELAIIISNDRQLSQEVNQIVAAELEEERAEQEAEAAEEAAADDEPEEVEDLDGDEDPDEEPDS